MSSTIFRISWSSTVKKGLGVRCLRVSKRAALRLWKLGGGGKERQAGTRGRSGSFESGEEEEHLTDRLFRDSALATPYSGHFHSPAMISQALNVLPRPAMSGEFVPADYFRKLA